MKYLIVIAAFFLINNSVFAQKSYEDKIGYSKLKSDLDFFCNIRNKANSGLYKYRTVNQIDSIEKKAYSKLSDQTTLREFFNIISELADYEGSVHNDVSFSEKIVKQIVVDSVYFPVPIKVLNGKIVVNSTESSIPLGAEIVSINGIKALEILKLNSIYYTTDGYSNVAKTFAQDGGFSAYLFFSLGKKLEYKVLYQMNSIAGIKEAVIKPVTRKVFSEHYKKRHSIILDSIYTSKTQLPYSFEIINQNTVKLNIRSFAIGDNSKDLKHLQFVKFLDSCFNTMKSNVNIKNLIVDVRNNGGGSDPNDVVAFSYLAKNPFKENTKAFSNFVRIPSWKNVDYQAFFLKRIIAKWIYQKELREEFSVAKDNVFYQGICNDNTFRDPNKNAFNGQIYLLVNPKVASAASLFASLVAGNTNAIVIGQETSGGYYGHNGHTPITYILPNSKIKYGFSIVNLTQDVQAKEKQPFGRGVIPDYNIEQTYVDFLNNTDTQMEFLLKLINAENK